MALPRLRNIEAFPVELDKKQYICIRDPENIVEEVLLLTPAGYYMATLLDGKRDIKELQEKYASDTNNTIIAEEDIMKLVTQLDKKGFLHSETFNNLKQKIEADFYKNKERPLFVAGKSYPAEPKALSRMLEKFISSAEENNVQATKQTIRGIIAPHIDYNRGGNCYGYAYSVFKGLKQEFDTFIILGVAHISPPTSFILTKKSFQTPFGLAKTDEEVISYLARNSSHDPFKYEIAHRSEHSIEFQTTFLKYLLKYDLKIVPILCSSFERYSLDDPMESAEIKNFINSIKEAMDKFASRTFFIISGADLAHVGPRFGDNVAVDDKLINWMRSEDERSLSYIKNVDALNFYKSVTYDGNLRKVCGLSSIYTALKLLEGGKGKLLNYNYAHDPAGGVVSFVSAAIK